VLADVDFFVPFHDTCADLFLHAVDRPIFITLSIIVGLRFKCLSEGIALIRLILLNSIRKSTLACIAQSMAQEQS